jgi:competence protein ComEC
VDVEVLHPTPGDASQTTARPNTRSCVLRVSNGTQTALLLGDIEAAQEAALVARLPAQALRVQWLLAPHHGSKTSSSPALVQATQPRFVLVQAGYRNRFNHPVPEVAARWRAAGAELVSSPECGAATWASSEPERVQCERGRAPRYWQHQVSPPKQTAQAP